MRLSEGCIMPTQTLPPPVTLLTADEFAEFVLRPENSDRNFELDRGKVVEMPRPTARHGVVCGNVSYLLGKCIRDRKRGVLLTNDAGLWVEHDPDTVLGPDVFVYDETIAYDDLADKWEERVPTLVVEVPSPNDRASKMKRRVARFLAMDVKLVWVLDPIEKTLTVHQAHRPATVLDVGDEVTGLEFIPDLRLKVSEFFTTP